jgi:pimeloyl-ACP methyl ester carboxylesterase
MPNTDLRAPRRRRIVVALTALLAALIGVGAMLTPAAASRPGAHGPKPTIVLVHGAFADASGWTDVIKILTKEGYQVLAPANPLRGVDSDSAYIASVLATITGPIVLVGHSYGGFVITNAAAGNPNVKALVYIAAFAPDTNDTVGGLAAMFPGSQLGPAALDFRPLPDRPTYDGYIKTDLFRQIFAADLPASTAAIMAATQRPADTGTLEQASGEPAWRDIPSWTLVARNDKVIPAEAQRFMAARAGANVVEVNASHAVLVSKPGVTADVILAAARATA